MTEDNYKCKVCGDKFEEQGDLTAHGKDNHPVFTESYAKEEETFGDYEVDCDCDKDPDCPKCGGKGSNTWTSTVYQGDEIDQQEDKPVQSHDEWQKELEGLKDEFSTEEAEKKLDMGRPWTFGKTEKGDTVIAPTRDEPKEEDAEEGGQGSGRKSEGGAHDYGLMPEHGGMREIDKQTYDPFPPIPADVGAFTEDAPDESASSTPYTDDLWQDKLAKEDGGADAPLKKVADLSENYRFLSKDVRAKIFESLGLTQGDASILAGLQWNELTRPIRIEASESYAKEDEEEKEGLTTEELNKKLGLDDEEDEDKAYESFYNLEKNHSSPDYKKKAIECNRCNEKFYHAVDRDVHFNEVHATEDTYNLPEECPFCKIEIPEGQDLDYHMSTAHGAHVPSDYTQTGVDAGMADANWDKIEYAGASRKKAKETKKWDDIGLIDKQDILYVLEEDKVDAWTKWEDLPSDLQTKIVRGGALESHAKEDYDDDTIIRALSTPDANHEGLPVHALGVYWHCDICDYKTYAGPTNLFANADPIKPHLRDAHGIGESRVKGKESRSSEIKKEIKKLQNIIQVASEENPLHMYLYNDKIAELENELASLGEAKANEGQGGTYGRYDYMLNPEHTDITTCIVCGRGINSHSNPSTDYKGMSGDAPPTDHYFLGGDVGGSDDKYDFESKATEHVSDQWWWKEVKWESGFDQDFLYCNHCGADLYAEASWVEPLNNVGDDKMNRVVPDHLRNHGISESYAKEVGTEICTCGHYGGSTSEDKNQHDDRFQQGHGACRVCNCNQFTWTTNGESYAKEVEIGEKVHGNTNAEGLSYWKPTDEWIEGYEWDMRDIVEGHPKVDEADTRWVKGQDEKWHEVDSSDRDYEQGLSEKPADEGGVGSGRKAGSYAPLPEETSYQENPNYDPYTAERPMVDPSTIRTTEADEENKCENCEREEEFLNDDGLCEDCEREAGIDRKESERDAYD